MNKISELNLKKLLLQIVPDETVTNGKKAYGRFQGWNLQSFEELEKINEDRKKDKTYNMYYIMLNREYMVFDTDEEHSYNVLVEYLKSNNLYSEKAITTSFRGRTKNLYYKRHFWFKVADQRQFKHIKEEAQIKPNRDTYDDCDIIFGNKGFIGEFIDTCVGDVPIIDISIYNDLCDELNKDDTLKSKEMEKVDITFSDSEDEDEPSEEKPTKKSVSMKENEKLKNTSNTNNTNNNELWEILDGLAEKRYNSYSYWLNIYFVFINEKLPIELFKKFSMKCKKYNEKNNENILRNIQVNNRGYTLATLYFYLKEDNPELFKKICSSHKGFWKNDLTEFSIASLYFNLFPKDYIYNNTLGWFEYNQNNILVQRGKDIPLKLLQHLSVGLQELAMSYRNSVNFDDPQFKEKNDFIGKFHKTVGKTGFKKNCIIELSGLYNDDELINKLNKVNLLAFNNCVYDIETNKYRRIMKEDYITLTTGYGLEITEKNGEIVPINDIKMKTKMKEIIKSIFENKEIEKFWFYSTSSCLFGNVKERFYIHSGRGGGNGKGLTQQIISNCLGKYYKQVSNNFLMGSVNTGNADPELAQTIGVRYVSVNEPDDTQNKKFNTPKLKELSGNNKISTRNLYGSSFEFLPQFTINISANEIPKMEKADGAIKRRLNIINYPFEFRDKEKIINPAIQKPINYELKEKFIQNADFIQAVIINLIHKAHKYRNTEFKTPKTILEKVNEYCNNNNELYDWFDEVIEITNDKKDKISAGDLQDNYNMSKHCLKKLRPVDFSKYMEQLGVEKSGRTAKGYFYLGIKYRQYEMDEEI